MIPNKTNYSQQIIDIIDAREIDRILKIANKEITNNEQNSATFILTRRKKDF